MRFDRDRLIIPYRGALVAIPEDRFLRGLSEHRMLERPRNQWPAIIRTVAQHCLEEALEEV